MEGRPQGLGRQRTWDEEMSVSYSRRPNTHISSLFTLRMLNMGQMVEKSEFQ